MSAWIIGIVGVVCLGVLLDIVVPEGETNKYIKGIFGIVTVVAIVAPLPAFFNDNFSVDQFFENPAVYQLDENYLNDLEAQLKKGNSERVTAAVEEVGVTGASIHIIYDTEDTQKIVKVNINVANAEYKAGVSNKDIEEAAASVLKINTEQVIIYGKGKS